MRLPLRQLLRAELAATLLVALPCLFLPVRGFAWIGLDLTAGGGAAGLVAVRMLGGALAAVGVGYGLALLRPQGLGQARVVAIAGNAIIGATLWLLIFQGRLATLPLRGKAVVTVGAAVSVVVALLFLLARARTPEPPGLAAALAPREPATRDDAPREDAAA